MATLASLIGFVLVVSHFKL